VSVQTVHRTESKDYSMCQSAVFSLDTGQESFPPLVYCLLTMIGSKSAQNRSVATSAEPCQVLASCTCYNVLVGWSIGLSAVLLGSHNSGDTKPGVFWYKNSTVECVRSAGMLSCNDATGSMVTVQMVLDPY